MSPVDELVHDLATTHAALLRAVEDLSQEELDRRPGDGAWSPGEILDHLAKSEAGTVKVCRRLLRQVREAGAGSDDGLPSQRDRLTFAQLDDRERKVASPEFVLPEHGVARDDVLGRLAGSRVELLTVAREARGTDCTGHTFPHPLLGALDLYQWLLFIAQHEERHTDQIRELTRA